MTTDQLIAAVCIVLVPIAGFAGLYAGFRLGVKHERLCGNEYHRGRSHGWGDGMRFAAGMVGAISRKTPGACPQCVARAITDEHLKRAREAAEADAANAKEAIEGRRI